MIGTPNNVRTVGPGRHFLDFSAEICGCNDPAAHYAAQERTVAELTDRMKTAWEHQRPALEDQRDGIMAAMELPI